jgi:hypothetical protein
MDLITDTIVALGASVMVVAAVHKASLLVLGGIEEHPLFQSKWREEHGRMLISLALLAELGAAMLLLLWPAIGLTAAILLTCVYSFVVWGLRSEQNCHCFGDALPDMQRKSALLRNAALIACFSFVLTLDAAHLVNLGPPSAAAVSLAVVVSSLVVSLRVVQNVLPSHRAEAVVSDGG